MTRKLAAAIDIGTNSVLLTIAELSDDAWLPVVERATITRLGQGVDRERRLASDAIARTLECLREYRRILDAHGVTLLDVVGTSALRDAGGGPELRASARDVLGVEPRVLSGDEEARLTFEGAVIGLDVTGELAVFDVGGGSTEIVIGTRTEASTRGGGTEPRWWTVGSRIDSARSLDLGSVRLFERHVHSDPPSSDDLEAIDDELARSLASVPAPPPDATLVGVAGTVTTLATLDTRMRDYDSARVHGARLTRAATERLADELARLTLAERKALPGLEPGRADVIVVGARIVRALFQWAGSPTLVVSDRGVRWGLLARRA